MDKTFLIVICTLLFSSDYNDQIVRQLDTVLGISRVSFEKEFYNSSYFSFNGDGYSICVLKLSGKSLD